MTASPAQRALGFVRRILAKDDEIVEEEPAEAGAAAISSIRVRDKVHLVGAVQETSSTPEGWQVELSDGTGTVTVLWMGRLAIPGIGVGTTMHVWGRVAARHSELLIYNPVYAIQAPKEMTPDLGKMRTQI